MARIECIFLDITERPCFVRTDATKFIVDEASYQLDAVFPVDTSKPISNGMLIGFHDIDDNLVFYEIVTSTMNVFERSVTVYAEHAAMPELRDELIVDKRPTNTSAGLAAIAAVDGTRWQVRTIEDCGVGSCRYWYTSAWAALQKVTTTWNCSVVFSWEVNDVGIIGRYIDIKKTSGAWRGKRFELHKGMTALKVHYDDSSVCTALCGRGKGEEINTEDGDVAYGRKISFADIVWSTANGDPVDKPLGQEWIEDAAATARFGRNGRKRTRVITFDDCTDKNELIHLTWDALQQTKTPKLTIRASIDDYEKVWGYKFDAIRMNDVVAVVIDEIGLEVLIAATRIKRDYINPHKTPITLGNQIKTIADIQAESNAALKRTQQNALYGAQVAQKNPELLKGYLDTMATRILSSGTNFYTDPNDGSLVFENSDNSAAVKITGEGILLADKKVAEEWDWGTAVTGSGIVADMITSGTIQATLIRIFGSDMFYWDAANIHIFDPSNDLNEIRIGKYDGTNYGIGFSRDGGLTWSSAIDFTGAHISTAERYSSASATNNSLIFVAGANGYTTDESTMYAYIVGYTGAQKVTPVVSSISGVPTGMTATKQAALSDLSVPIKVTVPAGVNLGSSGNTTGQITVHVTSPVQTDIILSWAKINSGADGADGADGEVPVINLSTENITFTANSDGVVYKQTPYPNVHVSASVGGSAVLPTIQSITGLPEGMTFLIATPRDTTAHESKYHDITFIVEDGSTLGSTSSTSGQIKINFSFPLQTVRYVSWSKINEGTDGSNGEDGSDGTNGINTATIVLYQRAASKPSVPASDLTYTFATGDLSGSMGNWERTIPDGSNPVYSISAFLSTVEPTATVPPSAWSTPTVAVVNGANGTNGEDGADGLSRADVFLYQRAANAPAVPAGNVVYTFLSGGISGNFAPWQTTIPASDGNPCWKIQYTAIAATSTVTIKPTDWTAPSIIVKDGTDGKDGQDGKDGADGTGSQTFYQDTEPDPLQVEIRDGDLWFDSANDNRMYRWNAATSAWVAVSDMSIDKVMAQLVEAQAALDIAESQINALVSASYITNDDLQAQITTLRNELTATEDALTAVFTKEITSMQGTILSDVSTLIRASGDGVEVGRSDSKFKTLLTNDRLSFIQNESGVSTEVAYISDKKLYITDAQVTNELAIGEGVHKLFKFRRTTNGLMLIYQS